MPGVGQFRFASGDRRPLPERRQIMELEPALDNRPPSLASFESIPIEAADLDLAHLNMRTKAIHGDTPQCGVAFYLNDRVGHPVVHARHLLPISPR